MVFLNLGAGDTQEQKLYKHVKMMFTVYDHMT